MLEQPCRRYQEDPGDGGIVSLRELARRQGTFRHTLLNLVTQLAAKGIHGGPTAALVADAAANEINERIDIAIQEVLRAAQSTGVRFYAGLADDLGRVLEQITEGRWNDVLSSTRDQLRAHPNPSGVQRDVEMTLTGIPASRIAKGKADLRHFAESLSTRQRATNREMWLRGIFAVGGAIGGSAATWLLSHVK